MYFHNDIIITKKGFRIRPKALNPVGITDGSVCWGIAVSPAPNDTENRTPDLLISEFHPKSWHVLFRLKIEMNDKHGALKDIINILNQSSKDDPFNILSIQCAPTSYNYATLNIIGEAIGRRDEAEKKLADIIKNAPFYSDIDIFDKTRHENDDFLLELTKKVTLGMLRYRLSLENAIEDANDKGIKQLKVKNNFLRDNFKLKKTLLYWIKDELEQEFKDFELSLPKAVQVRWLKQLATYRIYNQAQRQGKQSDSKINVRLYPATWEKPIRFRYNAKNSFLEPQSETDKKKYRKIINESVSPLEIEKGVDFPVRALGSFNPDEHYFRVILPREDKKHKRLSIELDYEVDIDRVFSTDVSSDNNQNYESICSIGLLKKVVEDISDFVNLRYISNSISSYSNSSEKGTISMVGTTKDNNFPTDELKNNISLSLREIDKSRDNVEFTSATVGRFGGKRLFISSKFEYLNAFKPTFLVKLNKLVTEYGFVPIYGDPQITPDESDGTLYQLESNIAARIRASQAFLQIIPKHLLEDTVQDWLLYEYGVASGAGIPHAFCVDKSKIDVYPSKVGDGKPKFPFDSCKDSKDILIEVRKAIEHLANRVYDIG